MMAGCSSTLSEREGCPHHSPFSLGSKLLRLSQLSQLSQGDGAGGGGAAASGGGGVLFS